MVSQDEDALICDFAEYYNIYNYKEYSLRYVATLAYGLRENSRIKMSLSDSNVSFDTLILASILDATNFIAWTKTENARSNTNRPKSLVDSLRGIEPNNTRDYVVFNSANDFEEARAKLMKDK